MSRAVVLRALASLLTAACAASHGASDVGPDAARDAAALVDALIDGGDAGLDGDAALDVDAGGAACRARCTVEPLLTGVLERPGDEGRLEFFTAAPSGASSLRMLLAVRDSRRPIPPYYPFWFRVDVDLEAGSLGPVQGGSGRPSTIGEPENPMTAFDAAILRNASNSAVALFRPQGSPGTANDSRRVRAAYLRWTGRELQRTDLGPVVTLPEPPVLWEASLFELPDGDLLAAMEYAGALHTARIAWAPGSEPAIVARSDLGAVGESGFGMAALSAAPTADGQWALAGGGHSSMSSRSAFAALAGPAGLVWTEPLGGSASDPPPHVIGGPDGAWVVRWQQNPADTEDTSVVMRAFGPSGLGPAARAETAPVPLPRDAQVLRAGGVTYAIWNVRAPDDLTDELLHVVLFGASDECPATQVERLARLPGETPQPASIYALEWDGAVLLLALAPRSDGNSEFSALRVSCQVAAGG